MAARPSLCVRMFLDIQRGTEAAPAETLIAAFVKRFKDKEWPSGYAVPEVYYYPPSLDQNAPVRSCLHAKCVIVDGKAALVSSANFTEAAQERNIEVGILIRSPAIGGALKRHFESLLEAGVFSRII